MQIGSNPKDQSQANNLKGNQENPANFVIALNEVKPVWTGKMELGAQARLLQLMFSFSTGLHV